MFEDLNGNSIQWKVSTIVEKESIEIIRKFDRFLQNTSNELYKKITAEHLKKGKPELEFDGHDFNLIEQFFLEAMQRGSEPQKLGLEQLETFIVSGIREAQKGGANVKKSFSWLEAELRTMTGNLKLLLDTVLLEIVGTGSSQVDVDKLKATLGRIKESDLFVLAEVMQYGQSKSLKCILASVDYTDFVKNAQQIEAETGVICSDPLYLISRYNGS
jgi:hypothetical protein